MNNELNTKKEKIGVLGNVTGRVQGVGFRHYTQVKAKELLLTGTVRNLPDGSVSVEAYGEFDQIKSFITWSLEGPESSEVSTFNYQFIDYREVEDFLIVR